MPSHEDNHNGVYRLQVSKKSNHIGQETYVKYPQYLKQWNVLPYIK